MTIQKVISEANQTRNVVDGEIWLFFNKARVDNDIDMESKKVKNIAGKEEEKTLFNVEFYTGFRIKESGKPANKNAPEEIVKKINEYVPKNAQWNE